MPGLQVPLTSFTNKVGIEASCSAYAAPTLCTGVRGVSGQMVTWPEAGELTSGGVVSQIWVLTGSCNTEWGYY